MDARKLLKATKRTRTATPAKKISSPFASYDSKNVLSCVVCKVQVQPASWSSHVSSKDHLATIQALKDLKANLSNPSSVSTSTENIKKRKIGEDSTVEVIEEPVFPDQSLPALDSTKKPKLHEVDGDENDATDDLPADFFDSESGITNNVVATNSESIAEDRQSAEATSNLLKEFDEIIADTTIPISSAVIQTEAVIYNNTETIEQEESIKPDDAPNELVTEFHSREFEYEFVQKEFIDRVEKLKIEKNRVLGERKVEKEVDAKKNLILFGKKKSLKMLELEAESEGEDEDDYQVWRNKKL